MEQKPTHEIVALLAGISSAVAIILAALYKYVWPAAKERFKARLEAKKQEQDLRQRKELADFKLRDREARAKLQLDFAADKRISDGLQHVIQNMTKQLTDLERKYDSQQVILIECISDRASLRTQVNYLSEEIISLNKRLDDG